MVNSDKLHVDSSGELMISALVNLTIVDVKIEGLKTITIEESSLLSTEDKDNIVKMIGSDMTVFAYMNEDSEILFFTH